MRLNMSREMEARHAIRAILAHPPSEDSEHDTTEAIEALIDTYGWPEVLEEMLSLLQRGTSDDAREAAAVIWGAVLDGRPIPVDKVIALLVLRYRPEDCTEHDDNLAWSIICKLKGVGYLSDYDARRDPAVVRELDRLQSQGQ
jgi:hypothetical protein